MCLGLESPQCILTCNPFFQDTLSTGSMMGAIHSFCLFFFFIELLVLTDHQHLHLVELRGGGGGGEGGNRRERGRGRNLPSSSP